MHAFHLLLTMQIDLYVYVFTVTYNFITVIDQPALIPCLYKCFLPKHVFRSFFIMFSAVLRLSEMRKAAIFSEKMKFALCFLFKSFKT